MVAIANMAILCSCRWPVGAVLSAVFHGLANRTPAKQRSVALDFFVVKATQVWAHLHHQWWLPSLVWIVFVASGFVLVSRELVEVQLVPSSILVHDWPLRNCFLPVYCQEFFRAFLAA